MNLTSLLGFLSLAGWILLLVGAGIAVSNTTQNKAAGGGISLALIGFVVGTFFFIASSGLVEVGATQVAVVFQRIGGDPTTNSLWPTPLRAGVHVIFPIVNEPIIYSVETRNYTMSQTPGEGGDDAVEARTSDGQLVTVDVAVFYSVNPEKANIVHIKWQNRYENDFVRPTASSLVRNIMADYRVSDIYSGAGLATVGSTDEATASKVTEMEQKIEDAMRVVFDENGLTLQSILLRRMTFSEEVINAIEARQVAEQQAQQAELEADRKRTIAQGDADAQVTAAKGEAQANIERAKGDAEAIVLRAQAEAQALQAISSQLQGNPLLIQWRYIEKLAETVSLILVPSNSPYLFDFNSLQQQAGITSGTNNQQSAVPTRTATPEPTAQP